MPNLTLERLRKRGYEAMFTYYGKPLYMCPGLKYPVDILDEGEEYSSRTYRGVRGSLLDGYITGQSTRLAVCCTPQLTHLKSSIVVGWYIKICPKSSLPTIYLLVLVLKRQNI